MPTYQLEQALQSDGNAAKQNKKTSSMRASSRSSPSCLATANGGLLARSLMQAVAHPPDGYTVKSRAAFGQL